MVLRHKKIAFSLTEALIVVAILATLSVSVAPVLSKKSKIVKDRPNPHGTYECFMNAGRLEQTFDADNAPLIRTNPARCEFIPPPKSQFFTITAVGGGGGARTTPFPSGGSAGEAVTIHYPSLPAARYQIAIGAGGANNASGAQTTVSSPAGSSPAVVLVSAAGGISGNSRGDTNGEASTLVTNSRAGAGGTGGAGFPGIVRIVW